MSLSKEGLVASIFVNKPSEDASPDKKGAAKHTESRTITSKFVAQLHSLRTLLAASDTRFVRCIKTNNSHVPDEVYAH